MSEKRQSNFELLRIISMIMIVFHHFAVHSGFDFNNAVISLNRVWVQFTQIGGKIGVNIFVLISGYFLINTEKFKISKILKLWIQILLTSIFVYIISIVFELQQFKTTSMIKSFAPIIFEGWWFISTYFVLYLISPFLNKLLKNLDKKEYISMLFLMIIIWCIIPTFTKINFQSNNLIWFVVLYSIAGYIRLYGDNWQSNNKKCFSMSIILTVVMNILVIILDLNNINICIGMTNATYLFQAHQIGILLISLFIFLGFKETNIKYNESINKIASTTLGIYLLHDSQYTRIILWNVIFKTGSFQNSSYLIPYSILSCAIIFLSFVLMEFVRIYILEKRYINIIYKIESEIKNLFNRTMNSRLMKNL